MAVSRVGGSKGKLSGQVGNVVYQIRKNPDGTFTQIIYEKGQHVETVTTPKLQAQRMCTAMVESLMRDLKPVGGISFQSGKNKSQSLNAFSSANIRLVQRDCQAHWYSDNKFVFSKHLRTDINIRDLGGPYMISSGTCKFNVFDELFYDEFPFSRWDGGIAIDDQFNGLLFDCLLGVETFGQFLDRHSMTKLDTIVFCGFREWFDWNEDDEESIDHFHHEYIIIKPNLMISNDMLMTRESIPQCFKFDSSLDVNIIFKKDGSAFAIGHICDLGNLDEVFWYHAGFTISQLTGRKMITDSFYQNPSGDQDPWLLDAAPTKVFGSWMGEYWNDHYPSPYI